MILVHIFLWIKKLSTLKRSCNSAVFTLKRSCLYAETLLLSIYTCIYLYITCSKGQKIVDNGDNLTSDRFFVMKFLSLFLMSNFLSACQKTIYICERPIHPVQVSETLPARIHPAQFYIYGNAYYPCSQSHNLFTSNQSNSKRKPYEKFDYKQTCVK